MAENKIFQFALLTSILIHFVFFLGFPHISFMPSKRALDTLRITYYKLKDPPKKLVGQKPRYVSAKLPEIKKEEISKPQQAAKALEKAPEKSIQPKASAQVKEVKEKRFESIVSEEADKAKKAAYISYYRAVREKIRQCADNNYPQSGNLGEGEVFLSFVVASNGELLQVRVVDERSVNNNPLKNIAINSVRDASPFAAFPPGMNQYQITFNVIISFELER
ncbi:MAG: TonB family protein [Candidatus Omnitrophota bacterium]